jgi:hypothetical protein
LRGRAVVLQVDAAMMLPPHFATGYAGGEFRHEALCSLDLYKFLAGFGWDRITRIPAILQIEFDRLADVGQPSARLFPSATHPGKAGTLMT